MNKRDYEFLKNIRITKTNNNKIFQIPDYII